MTFLKYKTAIRALGCVVLITLVGAVLGAEQTGKSQSSVPAGLNAEVREILNQHCVKCHGGEKTKGSFDLTTREGLLHPGDEGPNVVPGNADASRLMKLVRHEGDPAMPAKADKLPDDVIAKLAAWIDAGATYDKPLIEKA